MRLGLLWLPKENCLISLKKHRDLIYRYQEIENVSYENFGSVLLQYVLKSLRDMHLNQLTSDDVRMERDSVQYFYGLEGELLALLLLQIRYMGFS
jgi:hypothetical protein